MYHQSGKYQSGVSVLAPSRARSRDSGGVGSAPIYSPRISRQTWSPARTDAHSRLLSLSVWVGRVGGVQTNARTQPTGADATQSVRARFARHLVLSPGEAYAAQYGLTYQV